MSRESVLTILREIQPTLRQQHGVRSLSLFGSTARNEASEQSDVDLLVEFDRPTGLFRLFQLQNELQDLLGTRVDLGTRSSLRSRIKSVVEAEEVHVF